MKRIARLNLQSASNNTDEALAEICIFPKCNLKSIEGYNFCYQHVYADKLTKKIKKCSFRLNENNEKCNELITLPNENNLCTYHLTFEKNRQKTKKPEAASAKNEQQQQYKLIDDLNVDSRNVLNEQIMKKQTEKHLHEIAEQQQDEDLIDFELFDSDDSDTNEEDLDYVDALEHASVYTPEEVIKIFQIKMNKVQRLYNKQLNLINERMKYDRKVYLLLNENEKDKYGSNIELSVKNNSQKELLNAAKNYKKYSGLKTYLKENFKIKKNNEANTNVKRQCIFIENDLKCENKPIPLSKYCLNHILSDQNQILFCPCGGEATCKVPIIASITPGCPLHLSTAVLEKLKSNEEALNNDTEISSVDNLEKADDNDKKQSQQDKSVTESDTDGSDTDEDSDTEGSEDSDGNEEKNVEMQNLNDENEDSSNENNQINNTSKTETQNLEITEDEDDSNTSTSSNTSSSSTSSSTSTTQSSTSSSSSSLNESSSIIKNPCDVKNEEEKPNTENEDKKTEENINATYDEKKTEEIIDEQIDSKRNNVDNEPEVKNETESNEAAQNQELNEESNKTNNENIETSMETE